MKRFLVLSTFLISMSAFAFTCPNIRLDKDFPNGKPVNKAKYKTMQSQPVLEQDLGICYAYSAVQIADAVRHKRSLEKGKKPDNKVSSPLFLAVNTKNAWDKQGLYYKSNGDPHFPFEGGHLCDAFKTADKLGTCPKEKLDIFFTSDSQNEETFMEKLLEVEEKLKKQNEKLAKEKKLEIHSIINEPYSSDEGFFDQLMSKSLAVSDSIDDYENDLRVCTFTAVDELYNNFKEVFGDAFKINHALFKTFFSPDMFDNTLELAIIFNNICPKIDRMNVNTSSTCHKYDVAKAIDSGKKYPFTQKILEQLSEDSLPVGISYCAWTLTRGPDFRGITTKTKSSLSFKKDNNGKNDCGNHASVITGSRWNPKSKSCELLVRNSWGSKCYKYKKHYPSKKRLEEINKNKEISQYDVKCEEGSIWVDYKTLEKNTYRVQHL